MTKLFLIATAMLGVASGPVVARDSRPAAASADAQVSAARPANTENQRICLVDTATGSRIPIKECKTRAQWRAAGIDPLASN